MLANIAMMFGGRDSEGRPANPIVGLLVALPAVAAYNYFQRRITGLCASSEVLSSLVLAYLSAGTDPKRGPHG